MRALTVAIWAVSLGCLLVAGVVALEFVLIPMSLDTGELLTAGSEPWSEAGRAAGAFIAFVAASAFSLGLWHTARFKLLAWMVAGAEVAALAWLGRLVYLDYL